MHKYQEKLNKIISFSAEKIREIPNSEINLKPSPDKWSKKEILGHLIDSAYNNHQRFLRAVERDNLVFRPYNQVDWVLKNNYQNREIDEILDIWIMVNNHINVLVGSLSDELLNKETTDHNFHVVCMNAYQEGVKTSLSYLIWDYIFHLEHHLSQIIPGYEIINEAFDD